MSWYRLDLGDAMLAEGMVAEIRRLSEQAHEEVGRPSDWAVYLAHISGDLHCRAQLYFSPAAAEFARSLRAQRCDQVPERLSLLAGDGAGLFDLS